MELTKEQLEARRIQTIKEFDGIWPPNEVFYIKAIVYTAGIAHDAFVRFEEAVIEEDSGSAVAFIQEALTHVAALSRFFWPARDKGVYKARAAKLRATFGLDEQSPLADRQLRNAMEHFDERLDEFLLSIPIGTLYPGPIMGPVSLNTRPRVAFRLVDPDKVSFVLLGVEYSFGLLQVAIREILEKALHMERNGGRLRPKR